MKMSQVMMRSMMAAALVLGLAACESAPQPISSSGGGGSMSTGPSMQGGGRGGVGTGSLEEQQRQFAANVGDRVFFDYDSYALKPAGQQTLDRQTAFLRQNAQFRIVIEGHSDERGTREYNLALSERRATTVRNYLVNQGIPASRISIVAYGKERPVALGGNEASWAENRRGVTVLAN